MDKITQGALNDILRRGRKMIAEHGWMVQGVGGDPSKDVPSYSYSVGLSKNHGHPEIFMVGFPFDLTRSLTNVAGSHIKDGMRFDKACYSDVIVDGFPVAFLPLDRRSVIRHTAAGRSMLNDVFEGVQMFLPDPNGLFPWDSGCDPTYATIQTSLLETVGGPPERHFRVPGIS
jgi:hypothetical protein